MPSTPGDVKSTTQLKTYKCELRQAYEKKDLYKARLTFFVNDTLQHKIAETASDKPPQGKLAMSEIVRRAIKKVPGLILNLLNDTNLSEFLAQKVVSWRESVCLLDA